MIFRNGKLVTQVFKTILKGRDLRIYDSNGFILRDINQTVLNFKKETVNPTPMQINLQFPTPRI